MKLQQLALITLGCLGFSIAAQANEVVLKANQPIHLTFRVAHKNQQGRVVLGELQSADVAKDREVVVPVDLTNYELAGAVIISANGHELPPSANQFDQPRQCSMTTDKTKSAGSLEFTLTKHEIQCSTKGGIFG